MAAVGRARRPPSPSQVPAAMALRGLLRRPVSRMARRHCHAASPWRALASKSTAHIGGDRSVDDIMRSLQPQRSAVGVGSPLGCIRCPLSRAGPRRDTARLFEAQSCAPALAPALALAHAPAIAQLFLPAGFGGPAEP